MDSFESLSRAVEAFPRIIGAQYKCSIYFMYMTGASEAES